MEAPRIKDELELAMRAVMHFDGMAQNFTSNRVIIGKELFEELISEHNRTVVTISIDGIAAIPTLCGNRIVIDCAKGRERVFEVGYVQKYEIPRSAGTKVQDG